MSNSLHLPGSDTSRAFLRNRDSGAVSALSRTGALNARHLNPVLWGLVIVIVACGVSILLIGLTPLAHASPFLQALPFLATVLGGVVIYLIADDRLAERDLRRAVRAELSLSEAALDAEMKRQERKNS